MIDEQSAPPGTVVRANCTDTWVTAGQDYTVKSWATPDVLVWLPNQQTMYIGPASSFDLPPHQSVTGAPAGLNSVARGAATPTSRVPTPSSAPVGSWVESVYSQPPYLTVGRAYEVKRWSITYQRLDVIDDTGASRLFAATLFEVIPPPAGIGGAAQALLQAYAGTSSGHPIKGIQLQNISWDDVTFQDTPRKPNTCPSCEIELCAELDAYYGKDAFLAAYCTKCRRAARHSPNLEEIP